MQARAERRRRAQAQAARDLRAALGELGATFFDEALCFCDSERDAALLASATLVRALEREKILAPLLRAA